MQQFLGDTSLSWPHVFYLAIAGVLGWIARAGYKWVRLWLEREKPGAEVHETQARATEIIVRSHSTAGDAVIRFMNRLDEAQKKIDALHLVVEESRREKEEAEEERDTFKRLAGKQQTELKLLDAQMKRMTAIMQLKGIKLSDFDEPKNL